MRFLFVGTSTGLRGTETHLIALSRSLVDLGHTVDVLAHPRGAIAAELAGSSVNVLPGIFRNAADPRGLAALWRSVRSGRPDWILASFGHEYWPVVALGRLTGTRVALFRHLPRKLKPTSRYLLPRTADRFIAVSESLRQDLVASGIDPRRVQKLMNPIDLERFHPDPARRIDTRAVHGFTEEHLVVGFAGAATIDKGAPLLAKALNEALRKHSPLRALWIGDEPRYGAIKQVISPDLMGRHTFLPATSKIEDVYRALDFLVVPSIRHESFGRVSIEAQACGVPVIASDVGGLPETLLPGKSGWLIPAGDEARLSDALSSMSAMAAAHRRAMGTEGIDFARSHFEASAIARELVALLGASPPAMPPRAA